MSHPLQIAFDNMARSEAVEAKVHERYEHLAKLHPDRITHCKVTIDAPHRHQRHGKHFDIRLVLEVPGGTIVVSKSPGDDRAHEDVCVAIRDAFNAAERNLRDFIAKRGDGEKPPIDKRSVL